MAEPQECAKPEAREESRAKDGGNGSGVSSPFQAPHAGNASSSGAAAGAGLTGTSDSVTQGSSSDDTQRNQAFDLPDIFKSVPHDINISTRKDEQRGSEAPVPSTSMLPIQSGAPIHVYSSQNKSSQPVSSSSSAQSLPTPSQLLKGKQKEGSMPLSPFGQNDTNNYRADRDENQSNTSALKAFSRPGAADTQISATTSDFQAGSSLPSQHWSSLGNSAPTTILSGFSLPSEGLFPSDGSDMADLFGPGSNVLFEQIRAGKIG